MSGARKERTMLRAFMHDPDRLELDEHRFNDRDPRPFKRGVSFLEWEPFARRKAAVRRLGPLGDQGRHEESRMAKLGNVRFLSALSALAFGALNVGCNAVTNLDAYSVAPGSTHTDTQP